MILQLEPNLAEKDKTAILEQLKAIKYKTTPVKTQYGDYLIGIGKGDFDIRRLGHLPGIKDIHIVSDTYKLVSRKWKVAPTVVDLGDGVKVGDGDLAIMAGPCSIEDEKQIEGMVAHLVENGVRIMRGGVFKPRSSPYAFRGLGIDGLKLFHRICRAHGIKIITEVMQVSQVDEMLDYVDVFQVGARNTQNFNLLDALGRVDKPVLIKRGLSGTIDELLQSAEYVFSGGNERIMLCERGIRTYETASRNTLDLNAVPILKEKSHLPVVVDPSHGIGIRDFIEPMALAAVMAGADAVIYEAHATPEEAASDGAQTLNFQESADLIRKLRLAAELRKTF
jgi:3-deoxy-7-phosphoheptulonate synthase